MNSQRLEARIRDRWMNAQPIAGSPEPREIVEMIEEEGAHCANTMTRDDTTRMTALDMALRHAESQGNMDHESICKTAELFRRFLSGETWAVM